MERSTEIKYQLNQHVTNNINRTDYISCDCKLWKWDFFHARPPLGPISPALLRPGCVFTCVQPFPTASSASSSAPEGISHSTSYILASCQTPQTCSCGRDVKSYGLEASYMLSLTVNMCQCYCMYSEQVFLFVL